ncbi:MAG: matrixin family metalloprotease [Deltaproteobacteria bacterium]|nr:matrixin family metalloprotease [Deltaproteobacteria bacterium]
MVWVIAGVVGADGGSDAGPAVGACTSPTAYSTPLDGGIGPDAGDYLRTETSTGSGLCLAWATRNIGYKIGANGSDNMTAESAQQAIRDSFTSWSKEKITACTSELTFTDLGTNSSPVLNGTDRVNNIFWVESGWTSKAGHSASAIALTTNSFYASSGEIIDSDMEFNGQFFTFTIVDGACANKQDIQNTATHEIGHLIGLDHPSNPEVTMYSSAPSCETKKRSLESGDQFGVCEIYGPGKGLAASSGSTGCCKNEISPSEPHFVGPAILVLLLAVALARTGRKRGETTETQSK